MSVSNSLHIDFEHDFQSKLMLQTFAAGSRLHDEQSVRLWRQLWMAQLSAWHTPYKALIDCQYLTISEDPQLKTALETLLAFMQKLFLRKAVGFNFQPGCNHELLPFAVLPTDTAARQELGIRMPAQPKRNDLRSQIIVQNHFRQQVVEVCFSQPFVIDNDEKLTVLKSKLTNNLMQWHSQWSLLIDCSNFSIAAAYHEPFRQLELFLQRYFLQKIIGYNIKQAAKEFPFAAFRSKHKAALQFDNNATLAGDEAHCRSRSPAPAD